MRIIAGEFKSRPILSPPDGSTTRPIPDRVKESLFGMLRGHTEGAHVFDAFAGTGPIGLEALSRGAAHVVFIERERSIAQLLRQNITDLGVEDRAEVVMGDALGSGALARCPSPAHLIFFDPPFPLLLDPTAGGGWARVKAQLTRLVDRLDDNGYLVLRTPWPMIHILDEHGQPIAQPKPDRAERTRKPGKRTAKSPRRRDDDDDDADTERLDDDHGDTPGAPPGPVKIRQPVDLALPNARGPETHVYHAMAVHLYMKKL